MYQGLQTIKINYYALRGGLETRLAMKILMNCAGCAQTSVYLLIENLTSIL